MGKIAKLHNLMEEKELDCLLIESKVTKNYIGTLDGSGCRVFITHEESFLILDGRYLELARQVEKDLTIVLWNPQDEGESYLTWVKKYMTDKKLKHIGVESNILIQTYQKISSFSNPYILTDELDRIRMIKDSEEIKKLKKAIDLTDKIYMNVLNELSLGMTDFEISALLNYYSLASGASGMSFATIIGLGEKSAYPHVRPSGEKIKKGQIIMIDFGLVLGGFQSDMTRMSCFGEPNEEIKKIHEIVLKANENGISNIKAGNLGRDADRAARIVIEQAGYGQYFNHGLGHGIGMDNSTELPKLNAKSDMILEENMVMSCEPGIYIPGVGGVRIEDDIWISGGQGISLNNIDKKIQIL